MKLEWEQIDNYTRRAKVIGGWLVLYSEEVAHNVPGRGFCSGWDLRPAMCYVPDPEYKWEEK